MKVKKARKWRKRKRKQASATSKTTTPLVTTHSKSQSQLITASLNKEHPSPVSDTRQSTDRPLTDESPTSLDDSSPVPVDLTSCSSVQYMVKEGVHGVSYRNHLGEQGWTPVIGRKKRRHIPDYIKRRFPRDHPVHNPSSGSESDEQDLDNVIPSAGCNPTVNVNYKMIDNISGLSVKTRCTKSWTPVAARTRARVKK